MKRNFVKYPISASTKFNSNENSETNISTMLYGVVKTLIDAALGKTSVHEEQTYSVGSRGYKVKVAYDYSYVKNVLQTKYLVQVRSPAGGVVNEYRFNDSDSFISCMSNINDDYA